MHASRLLCWVIACTFLLVAFGCSNQEKLHPVTVTVTLDGEPLRDGTVYFTSTDGKAPAGGQFTDGRIEFMAYAGPKRVEITAFRGPTPEELSKARVPLQGYDSRIQILPARYNSQSTLPPAEVTGKGPNEFRFDLDSKPDPPKEKPGPRK